MAHALLLDPRVGLPARGSSGHMGGVMLGRISILGAVVLAVTGLVLAHDASDAWLTTKAKIKLLTSTDTRVGDAHIDTDNGTVTLHGKVESQAAKEKAGAEVGKL